MAESRNSLAEQAPEVRLAGWHDALVYYGPTTVPVWAALFLGLDGIALTWLIWLELLPRGLLIGLEAAADVKYGGSKLSSQVGLVLVMIGVCLGAMGFFAAFFPPMTSLLGDTFGRVLDAWNMHEPMADALAPLKAAWWDTGVLAAFAVATVARAWRAWWIDVRKDPAMAHVRHDQPERRTRRMYSFPAIILWIAFLGGIAPSTGSVAFNTLFNTMLATIYCLLPLFLEMAKEYGLVPSSGRSSK